METPPDAAAEPAADAPQARPRLDGLGAAAIALAALQAVTGGVLLVFVRPTAPQAAFDLVDLEEASLLGLLPALHLWGSHLLVVAVALGLLRRFLAGRHRPPHGRAWRRGVAVGVLVLALALSGSVLSWRPSARAATAAAAGLVGLPPPPDRALGAVFALHAWILPLLAAGLVASSFAGDRGERPR